MESYNTYLFEIGFFYSAKFPRPMPVVACVSTLFHGLAVSQFLNYLPFKRQLGYCQVLAFPNREAVDLHVQVFA